MCKDLLKKKPGLVIAGLIIGSLFFIIGIPVLINELYKIGSGYITLWSAADVLSFYAVILSGLISIGILIVTIHFNKKETEKQINLARSQVNVPFFSIENIGLISSEDDYTDLQDCQKLEIEYYINEFNKKDKSDRIRITLKNIGDGVAIDPKYKMNCSGNLYEGDASSNPIPKFVQKCSFFDIQYNLCQVLPNESIMNRLDHVPKPFESCIMFRYKNTLGVEFAQKLTLQYRKIPNKPYAVAISIKDLSHQSIIWR